MTPLAYDRAFIWHPYASLNNPPPVREAKSAHGVEIELADGSLYTVYYQRARHGAQNCALLSSRWELPY